MRKAMLAVLRLLLALSGGCRALRAAGEAIVAGAVVAGAVAFDLATDDCDNCHPCR